MAGIVEITDQDERGFLTVELKDLLVHFEDAGPNLVWSIQDFEALGNPETLKTNLPELEREARESSRGFILKWEDLVTLAQSLVDVQEALIAACQDRDSIPRLEYNSERFEPCEIAIEVFDSSVWRVYARDDAMVQRVASSYQSVLVIQV